MWRSMTCMGVKPKLGDLGDELIQPSVVIGDGMVSQSTTNHTRQPSSRFPDAIVSAAAKLDLDRCKCSTQSLATGTSQENKTFVLPGLPTTVRKTKELKRLARLPSFAIPAVGRSASELQQSRFLWVQFGETLRVGSGKRFA